MLFVQFFKNGSSSEIGVLSALPGIQTAFCPTRYGFYKNMDDRTRALARTDDSRLLESALDQAESGADLLVLDEVISACNHGMVSLPRLLAFLHDKPEGLEVVLTGRNPSAGLQNLADYVTEMRKIKHPYDHGLAARKGIEF